MNKRIASLCMALALLLCLLPAAPTAAAVGGVDINETNFPDQYFRLFVSNYDQNGDGKLSQYEIDSVTEMDCSNHSFTSLKGIEFFTGLTSLNCGRNQLTALDVSQNTALIYLFCHNNQLTSLDVSGCTALIELNCDWNQLTTLDVSQNTSLIRLDCSHNHLTALDLGQNTSMDNLHVHNNQLTTLDVSGCAALYYLTCYENQLTALDLSSCTAIGYLECQNNQLTSLEVSGCTELKKLLCFGNQLTALDVSRNTALHYLNCDDNQLTALDLSQNTELFDLYCDGNQLMALDLSENTALLNLYCDGNQLTALDLSENTALRILECSNNQLTSLDVSRNTALKTLRCYGNQLDVLDLSAVPNLLHALKNGTKTVRMEEGVIQYESKVGRIEMDIGQKTIPAHPFLDVTEDDFFYDAVSWAYQNGIASGTGNNTFSPDKTCTREQVVTFLWRAFGCPEPTITANPFRDVPNYAYYAKAVLWALEQGITTGKSRTKFGVGDPCTRAQAVTFLWRAEGSPEPSSCQNPFTDVSETSYFYTAVLWALAKGVTRGTSASTFSPSKTCTRGEVVTFLYRDLAEAE